MAVFDSQKWSVLSRLKPHLLHYRLRIAAGFVCVLLTNIFLLATPRVTGYAVDRLTEGVTREKLIYYSLIVVGLAICEGIFRFFVKRIHDLTEESQARLADLSARVQESMSGIRVVKAFVQEKYEIADFEQMNQSLVAKNRQLIRIQSVFYPTMELMIGFAVVVVIWVGGRQVIQGTISLGDFVAFTVYLARLTWPMIALGWVVNLLERGRASMQRLNYIFDTIPDVKDSSGALAQIEIEGSIEFRNLDFAYNGKPTLKNISLVIPKGKTV